MPVETGPGPEDIVLRLSGITKRFGPLIANDGISLSLRRGEVLALLGENGAGKTTLMNILFGHYVADAGSMTIRKIDAGGGSVTLFGAVRPGEQVQLCYASPEGIVREARAIGARLRETGFVPAAGLVISCAGRKHGPGAWGQEMLPVRRRPSPAKRPQDSMRWCGRRFR